jgi:hypothetical protein
MDKLENKDLYFLESDAVQCVLGQSVTSETVLLKGKL